MLFHGNSISIWGLMIFQHFKKTIAHMYFQHRQLLNLILRTFRFLSMWKTSKVITVFENDDRFHLKNYRPITLICNFNKVSEICVHEVIYAHISSYIIPARLF